MHSNAVGLVSAVIDAVEANQDMEALATERIALWTGIYITVRKDTLEKAISLAKEFKDDAALAAFQREYDQLVVLGEDEEE